MPEGPECREETDHLRQFIKGKTLLQFDVLPGVSQKYQNLLQSPYLTQLPLKCLDVLCRGKQIFFFMDKDICMYGGLGMDGRWFYFDSDSSQQEYLQGKKINGTSYPKFVLSFGFNRPGKSFSVDILQQFLWYDDKRNFGNFTIGTWGEAFQKFTQIGPDWLATRHPFDKIHPLVQRRLPELFFEQVTLERFRNEVRSPRRQQMMICKFLREPQYLSGIGNYLKCEILYRSEVDPFRPLSSLTDDEISQIYAASLNTISQSYQCKGLTHGTFLNPRMEKGVFEVYIYKKEVDPNGYTVIHDTERDDGRGTYYVPQIQK